MTVVKKRKKFDIQLGESYNEDTLDHNMKPEKHIIIGLTGNIGSGKSTVLNMLRHLGAYGIDADALTRKAFQQADIAERIMSRFGTIDRKSLAAIVFSDATALVDLEKILHPRVTVLAKALIQHANLPIIAIEAIKLIESDLAAMCDSIWVVDADQNMVTERLKKHRGMRDEEITRRMANQSPTFDKIKKASVVINNSNSYEKTWQQIIKAWNGESKKNGLSSIIKQTDRRLAPFEPYFVHPFSDAHYRILSTLQHSQKAQSIPGNQPVTGELVERWICEQFILTDQNGDPSKRYFVWNLKTLSFTLQAFFGLEPIEKLDVHAINLSLAESFANLHQVESLITPHPLPFNNYKDIKMEIKGFEPDDNPCPTEWHNAGYNLTHKPLRDVNAYLSESLK